MTFTPLGPISKNADRLELMIRATNVFSSLGAAVYHHHLPEPANKISHTKTELAALRPFIMLWTNDRDGITWTRDTAGPDACAASDGELVIRFERNTPANMSPSLAARDFENLIGRLAKGTAAAPGLIDLAGDPQYLPLVELRLVEHSRTLPEKINDIGDAQRAYLLATWSTA